MIKAFDVVIHNHVSEFLKVSLKDIIEFAPANQKISDHSGIKDFFGNQEEFLALKDIVSGENNSSEAPDRGEYGDFQTNFTLASEITEHLKKNQADPEFIVEPTCGKGTFIIASLNSFKGIKKIFAIEIYKPYVWETKFNILQFAINNPAVQKPEIIISHANVFDFDFNEIISQCSSGKILIIGNPPWVTNAGLSILGSNNLPVKSNFKKHSGLDAITGKGNFDIGEYITLMMLEAFENVNGDFAFLVKNSVVKNVILDQKQRGYKVSDLRKYNIDSKKEFNVSVEASLFTSKLNTHIEYDCKEFNFSSNEFLLNNFGWVGDKFVSDIEHYKETNDIDGISQFEWRQGVKHDCSAIMEFNKVNGHFTNALSEEFELEEDLVYGMLKSSDLKETVIDKTRKYTIITQKKVGQETSYIENQFPKTFDYLAANKSRFDVRKSSIYRNKPMFSIFGIGDYSFKPYKVAISGLYKSFSFNLILPQNNKSIMLDDTCYFIGFDSVEFAAYTLILLNSKTCKSFLQSITFSDAKRTFTKDILMRIDLLKLSQTISKDEIYNEVNELNKNSAVKIEMDLWNEYIKALKAVPADLADQRR